MHTEAYSGRYETAAERLVRIEIFDPPMCCPTGLCGPAVDPALLDIYEAVLKIKAEYDGKAEVERYVLGQQPAKCMQQPEVVRRLKGARRSRPAGDRGRWRGGEKKRRTPLMAA
jgi:hypothetical protein